MNRVARVLAPLGFGVAVFVLIVAGRGDLGTPPVDGFGDWLDEHGAVVATVAIARLAALGAAAWMFVFSTVVLVARAVGAVAFADLMESAVPPSVRRALAVAAGVGAVGVPMTGVVTDTGPPSPEAVQLVADPGPTDSTVTMSLLDTAPPPPEVVAMPVAAPTAPSPVVTPTDPDAWTVGAGESFWSIAEEVVTEQLGRPPTDEEVAPFWRALVDANRDRLLSPDPNLLVPGQTLSVPSAPTASAAAATPHS